MSDYYTDDVIRGVDDVESALDFLGHRLGNVFRRGDFQKAAKKAGYTFTNGAYASLTYHLRLVAGREGSGWLALQHPDTRRWHFVRKAK